MSEGWPSLDKIGAHFRVNPDTIYKWITWKSMPALKLGRLRKFLASEVDQWVKAGSTATDPTSGTNAATSKQKGGRH